MSVPFCFLRPWPVLPLSVPPHSSESTSVHAMYHNGAVESESGAAGDFDLI